jgi:hypothetical protein
MPPCADPSTMPAPRYGAAAVALALLAGAGEAGAQMTIGVHPRMPFPAHIPRPIKIDIGFYLIDFARIVAREETYDLQGYIIASWVDPELARKPGDRQGEERRFATDALWAPNYEFTNSVEPVKTQNEAALIVDDDGRITQRFRFAGKFAWPLDLRRFPFDSQTLTVVLEPFEREMKDIVFNVRPELVGSLSSAFVTDWTIRGVDAKATVSDEAAFGRKNSRMVAAIRIERQSTFYIWRILMPLTLLLCTSWVVYRFDPTNLQPLISTTVAILLNVILFNFSIDFALPKVPYLTFIDSYAVTCFFFMIANMFIVTLIHVRCVRVGADAARAIQAKALRFLPPTFVVLIALEAAYFLGRS